MPYCRAAYTRLLSTLFLLVFLASPAIASVTFYTDEASWIAAVSAVAVESLDTSSTNVALADEVGSAPSQDDALGGQLTFQVPTTGLCGGFTLQTIEPGAGFTFDDGEPSPPIFPTGTLSIGDIGDFSDDDFRLTFPTDTFYAAGLFLVDNTQDAGESLTVYGATGILGSLPGASIPDSSGGGSTFVGVVSTNEPLVSLRFNEDPGGDEIAIRDFRFGCSNGDGDSDGLSNAAEQAAGTNPNDSDSDDDGLLDGEEIGTGLFGAQRVIALGDGTVQSIVSADIDGDGDADVVAALYTTDEVAWYENTDGLGSFGAKQVISTLALGPRSVFAADVDGDGDVDVLSGSETDGDVAWYENTDGTGSFGPQQLISAVNQANSVFAVDLDGDDDLDVLSASFNDDKVAWYENLDGQGSFGGQQVISTLADGGRSVFGADVDGDGDADVLSASWNDDEVAWYENLDGAGTFGAQQVISILADRAWAVWAADLDGDGDTDVLSASENDDKIAWYENTDGQGTFGVQQLFPGGNDGARTVFTADVDLDGDTDVLSGSKADGKIAWYESTDGLGSFGPQQVITTLTSNAIAVVAGDVDGDGDPDVLSASFGDDKIAWYEQLNVADPLDPDSDDDGLLDGYEVANGFDPNDALGDADGDGLVDSFEVANGFDPNDPDENTNGRLDGIDDADADGLSNAGEQAAGTDPNDPDTDADGLDDGEELGSGKFGTERVITRLADGAATVLAIDLDGDGDVDAVTASENDDMLAWYENIDGLGNFGAANVISTTFAVPGAVFAADIDGDGDTDLFAYSLAAASGVWYENLDGLGGFGPEQTLGIANPWDFFAADLDGDEDVDLVAAFLNADQIGWYENLDGLGAFGSEQVITTLVDEPRSVFAADVDGDGDLDVLSASRVDNKIAWYENTDGLGSFGPQQVFSTGASSEPASVVAADVDGDGDLDVVSGSASSSPLHWHENTDGTGTFAPEQLVSSDAVQVFAVAAGDLDADGDVDVVSASLGDDTIAWHENNDGLGTFGTLQPISQRADSAKDVAIADVDGDGDLDVLSASSGDDKVAWYEHLNLADPLDPDSDGDGLLDGAEVLVHGTDPLSTDSDGDGLSDDFELAHGYDPTEKGEELLDLDFDGLANGVEIAAGTNLEDADTDDDGLYDGEELGTGEFGGPNVISTTWASAGAVFAADIDGDTDVDLFAYSINAGSGVWYENLDGFGNFGPEQILSIANPDAYFAADLDRDGDTDLVSAFAIGDKVTWYENLDGQGTFGSEQLITTLVDEPRSVFAADVDGDGDMDVLSASRADNKIAWYENTDGLGTFGPQQVFSTGAVSEPRSIVAVDVDGDGDLDAVSGGFVNPELHWHENLDGEGTFSPEQLISSDAVQVLAVAAGDFDADGDVDVVSASLGDDTIAWYENTDGLGTFGALQPISTTADGAIDVAIADVDADGDLDVLSASSNDDTFAWYENLDGAGNFGPPRELSTAADGAGAVLAADLDGDGDIDVVGGSENNDTLVWYQQINISDPLDPDSDDDGLTDGFEVVHGFDPLNPGEQTLDPDGDGLDNLGEQMAGTDPFDSDSDADRMFDGFEVLYGFDPIDPDQNLDSTPDGLEDADTDSLANAFEQSVGTHPLLADTDGDGLVDGEEIGTGVFGPEQVISSLANGAMDVHAVDLDGDGDLDVVSASRNDDEIARYDNQDGLGGFGPQQLITTRADGASGVFAGDLNGDGVPDVLSASELDDEIAWYSGGFGGQVLITTLANGALDVFAADLDGDGDLDVLSASYFDDTIAWYENTDGAASFGPRQTITNTANGAAAVIAVDVDGDGDQDVIAASELDGTVDWYENTDDQGSFGPPLPVATGLGAPTSIAAADVDLDGDVDVISSSFYDDTIAWYENTNGAGGFGPQQVISALTGGASSVSATDVDGDGDIDVFAAASIGDSVAWFENIDGTGTFGSEQLISTNVGFATAVFAADLDGDGDADLLSAAQADDEIAWHEQLNVSDPLDPDTDDDGVSDGSEVITYGTDPLDADTDGDGYTDGDEIAAGTDPLDDQSFGEMPLTPVPALSHTGVALLIVVLAAVGVRRSTTAPRPRT